VVVDRPQDVLKDLVDYVQPDFLQVHGHETPAFIRNVRREISCGIIKALPIATQEDVQALTGFQDCADHLLFDAKPPEGTRLTGGLGRSFDWSLLKDHPALSRSFLSGGLTPATVRNACDQMAPWGVDVSSGVEKMRGVKSLDLIEAFVRAVRSRD
jgi:phosphoribosylanthranilate isomerase